MALQVDLTTLPTEAASDAGPGPNMRLEYMQRLDALYARRRRVGRYLGRPANVAFVAALSILGAGFFLEAPPGEGNVADKIQNIALGVGVLALFLWFVRSSQEEKLDREIGVLKRITQVLDEQLAQEELAQESVDLDGLLKANRTLLHTYHGISTDQAQAAFRTAKLVMITAAAVFLLACFLALRSETVIGISLAGAAVLSSGVGGWVARTFLESYRISVTQAAAYFREPMVQSYLLAAHQIAQKMETPAARDEGLSRVMEGFLAAGLESARTHAAIGQEKSPLS